MKDNLSTEGRVYARQVLREIKRREPIGAAAFRAPTWDEGTTKLFNRIAEDPKSPFTWNAVSMTRKRLDAIPPKDRGFNICVDVFDVMTMTAGDHTLTAMEGLEEGVIVQRQCFIGEHRMIAGIVVANISFHAIGRFRERSTFPVDVDDGVALTAVCGRIGSLVASHQRLWNSEISFAVNGCVITGSMKVAGYPNGEFATAFYDVRTVLPEEACDEEQMAQARMMADCLDHSVGIEELPLIKRRQDFVLETLEASRRAKH